MRLHLWKVAYIEFLLFYILKVFLEMSFKILYHSIDTVNKDIVQP